MVKTLILSSALTLGLASWNPVTAQKGKQRNPAPVKTNLKFLDDISLDVEPTYTVTEPAVKTFEPAPQAAVSQSDISIENASELQIKYALLLDTEVEQVALTPLYHGIEEWWGTPYQYGGSSKKGIDCSAFTQILFSSFYGIELPRTAREQYEITRRIEREELREGDLIFFNTRGGVSHVGLYLKNNKFVHAATSGGVMISDLDEAYWAKRFIGVGRYQRPEAVALSSKP